MAKQIIEKITDDMDGSEGAQTIQFGYLGRGYEIDLGDKNLEKLNKALMPFIDKARLSQSRVAVRAKGNGATKSGSGAHAQARAWALANSIDVNKKGRVQPEIMERYKNSLA